MTQTPGHFNVTAQVHPLSAQRVDAVVAEGTSLFDMVGPVHAQAFIDGFMVPRAMWSRVKPKRGSTVVLRAIPLGGGEDSGKTVLRMVATLTLAVAAPYLAGVALGASFGTGYLAVAGGLGLGGAALSGAITMVGNLAINALIPPPQQAIPGFGDSPNRLPSITNTQNQARPFGTLPRYYGRYKAVPDTCVRPYTENEGSDQYLRQVFCFGYGPLQIDLDELKIGDTPLSAYNEVDYQFLRGYPKSTLTRRGDWAGGAFPTPDDLSFGDYYDVTVEGESDGLSYKQGDTIVFNNLADAADAKAWDLNASKAPFDALPMLKQSVNQSQVGLAYNQGDGETKIRTTSEKTTRIGLDFTLPVGLADLRFQRKHLREAAIAWQIEYSPTGEDNWREPEQITTSGVARNGPLRVLSLQEECSFYFKGTTKDTRRASVTFDVPEGQYDIRLKRKGTYLNYNDEYYKTNPSSDKGLCRASWDSLKSIRSDAESVRTDKPLALLAVRIKATDQLNGAIDRLNGVVQSMLPVWDHDKQRWDYQPTSNPAWIYRDIFTGEANGRALSVDRMADAELIEWAADNEANGREFNAPIDPNTVFQSAADVAAVGRASFGMTDGKYSVVRDRAQDVARQVFTPHNTWAFKASRAFQHLPDALRIKYIDPDADWQEAECIVHAAGESESSATRYEQLQLYGVTSSDQAKRDGAYHLAVGRLRPETYEFETDAEYAACQRGDLIRIQHDCIGVGLGSGRLTGVETNDTDEVTGVTLDSPVELEADKAYALRVRTETGLQQYARVRNDASPTTRLTFEAPLSGLGEGDLWTFGEREKETLAALVKEIRPHGEDMYAHITAVPYNDAIYEADQMPPDVDFDPGITLPRDPAQRPPPRPVIQSVRSDETVAERNDDGSLRYYLQVGFSVSGGPVPAQQIDVQTRSEDDVEWQNVRVPATQNSARFSGYQPGDIVDIRIRARSANNTLSDWVYQYRYEIVGRQPPKPESIDITRGTFSIQLNPQGGPPASSYEFWRAGSELDTAQIEAQATRIGEGSAITDSDLVPDTTYHYFVRTVNVYGESDWYTLAATTKNEPGAVLKNLSGQIGGSELQEALSGEIDKISGGTDVEGSVAKRIADEARQRADEIRDSKNDIEDRIFTDVTSIDLINPPTKGQSIHTQSIIRDRDLETGFNAGLAGEASDRADAILNARNALDATIEQNQIINKSRDESLANSIATFAAGSGEQFDSSVIWYYDDDLAGWTGGVLKNGYLVASAQDTPQLTSPQGVAIDGDTRRYVKARVRKSGNPAWIGHLWWKKTGEDSWQGPSAIEEPPYNVQGVTTIEWQDIDWAGEIDQIRIQLTEATATADHVDIDWLAIGRPTPGASTAALQREREARISQGKAEAVDRQTLAAQLRGDYEGNDLEHVSKGLVFEEKTARVTEDEAISSRVETLQSNVHGNTAAIENEAKTRADADSAEASARQELASNLGSQVDANANALSETRTLAEQNNDGIRVQSGRLDEYGTRIGAAEDQAGVNATAIDQVQTAAQRNADEIKATSGRFSEYEVSAQALNLVAPPGEQPNAITSNRINAKITENVQAGVDENKGQLNVFGKKVTQIDTRLKAFKLAVDYGFETGEVGQTGAPRGWELLGNAGALSYQPALGDSRYGSQVAYGAIDGQPGAWALSKTLVLNKGGSDLRVELRTRVIRGFFYPRVDVYNSNGDLIDQLKTGEAQTDFDGTCSIRAPMSIDAHLVKIHLIASKQG